MQETLFLPIVGTNLKRARKRAFPSDTQFDAALRIGVSRATYQKMEKGDLSIALGSYVKAAQVYSSEGAFNDLFKDTVEFNDLFKEFGV